MSDYLDRYSKKISQSGSSISDSISTNTTQYIQSKFKDSTTYRRAKYYHRKNDIEFRDEIDIRALDIRRMGNIIRRRTGRRRGCPAPPASRTRSTGPSPPCIPPPWPWSR